MLRYHTAYSSSAVKNYFSTADYYANGPETVGRWGGSLAAEMGLEGDVTKEAFGLLCDNINPATGKRLTARTNAFRRVGDDLIFSLGKELSAYVMLLPPEERDVFLEMAERRAWQVIGMMEDDVETRVRRDGAFENRPGGGMLVAGHRHTTARPVDGFVPDMHVHWHMFAFNVTRDRVENRLKAGDFSKLYRDSGYYEAVFNSLVAHDFAEAGLPIERRENGKLGLAGMQPIAAIFSKRTHEIEDEARRLGITDAAAKSELGAKTRNKKDKALSPEQLREAWLAQLSDDDRETLERIGRRDFTPDRSATAEAAVAFAVAHCSEKLSVIPERELMRSALWHGLGSVTPEMVAREMESPRHGLIVNEIGGRRMATTEALQEQECSMAAWAADGQGRVAPIGLADGLSQELADGKRLSDEQFQAVTDLLTSPNRVNQVQGPAGAGKSTFLAKFDEGARLAGETVTYLATTAKAVEVLQKDGFADTRTVAHFLRDEKMQQAAAGGRVVVDETSILGHLDALRLIDIGKRHNLKFIFVGDPMQHGSVSRGAFMSLLSSRGQVMPFRLTKIQRQQDADYRAAAQLLSEGRAVEGFDAIDARGWVVETPDPAERQAAMAAEYVQAMQEGRKWDDVLVVSPTWAEAAGISNEIRSQLRAAGKLGAAETEFSRLVPVDTSEAERGQAWAYRPGDVLIFHQNARGGITKGDRLVVADPSKLPLAEADKFSVYREEKIGLSAGDVLRFTGTVKSRDGKHTLKNGATHSIAEITPGGNIRLDNGWLVSGKRAEHFRHGFVDTSIGAQGRTVRRVILAMTASMGKAVNMQQLYVSASRGRERLRLFVDDKLAVRDAAARDSRQLLALDLKPAAAAAGKRLKPVAGEDRREREIRLGALFKPWHQQRFNRGGGDRLPPMPPPTHTDRLRARQQEGYRHAR